MLKALMSSFSFMQQDISGISFSLFVLGLILVIAEAWRHFFRPKVEWTRKFVHTCSGIVVASFPWLIKSVWSVVLIAFVMFVLLSITKRLSLLKSVHGVERKSYGDLYYLLAVITLFPLSRHEPAFYFAALLTLAVADALAAVIGSTYHRITFNVETDKKSFEGSSIFFLATFLTIHLPLLLMTNLPREITVLVALQIAIVVTLIEAIAIHGFDNIAIPLSVYFLLIKLTDKTIMHTASQITVQLILIIALLVFCKRFKYFSLSAGIVGHLFIFTCYALGGAITLPPALLAMIAFGRGKRRADKKQCNIQLSRYQMTSIAYVCFAPLAIIFIDNILKTFFKINGHLIHDHIFFALYLGSLSASVALSLVTLNQQFKENRNHFLTQANILLRSSFIPFFVIVPVSLSCAGYGSSLEHWLIATGFALLAPFIHLLFWHQQKQQVSYLAFQALSLGTCAILSSTLLIALNF